MRSLGMCATKKIKMAILYKKKKRKEKKKKEKTKESDSVTLK